MAQIPQYSRETRLNGSPLPYQHLNTNSAMFGAAQAQALGNMGRDLSYVAVAADRISNIIDETKIMNFNNATEQWKQSRLTDKENGYFVKQGADAAGKSPEIMKDYDDFVEDWKSKNRVSNFALQRIESISEKKRSGILQSTTAHDLKETQVYAETEGKLGIDNAISTAISSRNNPEEIAIQAANINNIADWKGGLQNSDEATISADKTENISRLYSSVIENLLQDGNIVAAKQMFEKHKDEINPQLHSRFNGAIQHEEDKYVSRDIADQLFSTSANETEAYKRLETLKNKMTIERYNSTQSNLDSLYARKRRDDNNLQNDLMDANYNIIDTKLSSGDVITENDLNFDGLDARNRMALRNYVKEINSAGDAETRADMYDELFEMSVNDAQNFKKLNLAQYRPFLSQGDYRAFKKRQQELDNFTPTQLKDDDKVIKDALAQYGAIKGAMGHFGHGDVQKAFINSARAYVREYELKHGKHLKGADLNSVVNDFANSFGYEDPESKTRMYSIYAEGMNTKVNFTRDVLSDWENAKKQKGRDLTDDEKYDLVEKRLSKTASSDNDDLSSAFMPIKIGDIWNGHRITQLYGKRTAPVKGATTDHKGIDLAYKPNEVFRAFASGTVTSKGYDSKLGNYVDVKSSDGTIHRYGHAANITVAKGNFIKAGEPLGVAGSTGVSTGVHVHYSKIKNGKFLDPLNGRGVIATNNNNENKGWAF